MGTIMKQLFKSLFLVASIAASLISCQKEQNSPVDRDIAQTVKLTVHASAENLKSDTKTYIDSDGKTIFWGSGEYMTAALINGEELATYNSNSSLADTWSGESEAMFEFDVELSAGPVTYSGIYPTSAVVDGNKSATSFKVELSAAQKASATSYDPAAYIMIAKPEAFTAATKEWVASFRRATALNKITLKNINDNIKSVTIIVPDDSYLAGRRYINLTTGEKGEIYNGGGRTNTLTVNYTTALASATSNDIWFTSWGVEIPQGSKMTVVAYSNDYSYTREITAREGGIKFNEGFLNTLSIDMTSAEKKSLKTFSGNYAVLVAQGENYYILSSTNEINATRLDAYEFSDYDSSTEYTDEDPLEVPSSNYIWTISSDDNSNYYFKNGENYLSYSGSDNTAKVSKDPFALTITEEEGGTYNISSVNYTDRRLAKNTSNKYFAFYTGTQGKSLILVPAHYARKMAMPQISYNGSTNTVTITAEDDATIYYTDDENTPSTQSTLYSEPFTITSTKTIKAIAHKDGCMDSEVCTSLCEYGKSDIYYKKVTSLLENYEGTFLILGTETSSAFTGTGSGWGGNATVTVENGKGIKSSSTVDTYAVTISKLNNGNYSIKANSGNYIASVTSNTFSMGNTAGEFTFEYDNCSKIKLTNGRYMKFVSGSGFRMYTSDTGIFSDLYKLDDGKTDPTITTENKTINTNGSQDVSAMFTSNSDGTKKYKVSGGNLNGTTFTASEAGTYTVTFSQEATDTYRAATKEATITVTEPVWTLQSIEITTSPTKIEYDAGEKFNPAGMVVTGTFTDENNVEKSWAVTGYTYSTDDLAEGTTSITISYTYSSVTKTANQVITVNAATTIWNLKSIAISTPPSKTEYKQGETLDLSGMVVTATYSDAASVKADKQEVVSSWTSDPANGATLSTVGDVTVTVSFTDGETKTATQTVKVVAPSVDYTTTYTSNVTFTAGSYGYLEKVKINNVVYECLRLASSKNAGSGTFNVPAGTTKLHIHLVGWSGNTTVPSFTTSVGTISGVPTAIVSDTGIANSSPYTLISTASSYYYELTLSNVTSETTITVSAAKGKRAVLFGVNYE